MDSRTSQYYSKHSAELAEKYDSCVGGISDHFQTAFKPGSTILDIGCGSGRDLAILHEMGYKADGVEPCEELAELARNRIAQYGAVIRTDTLPELETVADASYDGILCSAVLMHLPEKGLFDSVFAIRRVLRKRGRVLLSIPLRDETIDPRTKRDEAGRLFNGVKPEELQLLFERIGFKLLNRWNSKDSLNREHRKWATMLFELDSATGIRPIDTIESVLSKDAKVATYKLALFRALASIATTNYKLAKWTSDGRVGIPTLALAEKWIEYYWPIIESEKYIPQTTGRPIAFRAQLKELVEYYRPRGGLSAFSFDHRNGNLSEDAKKLLAILLRKLKQTIWDKPVRYAGGGGCFSLFQYDKVEHTVLIRADIWKELSLMGYWIHDATVLRWAEVTSNIAKGEIKPSEVIDCLLRTPTQERHVNAARSFYDALPNKECVWSGRSIVDKYDLDHVIPFRLWKNNDLWNLLPADPKENADKKDKLPENEVIKKRKDCIVDYWKLINSKFPVRFEYEAAKLMGIRRFDPANWKNKLFAAFAEAVEITAIQRGVERWSPSGFAATGTDDVRAAFAKTAFPATYASSENVLDDGETPAAFDDEKQLEPRLHSFDEVDGEAYVKYLPYVGGLAAGTEYFAGFEISDLEREAINVDWIEVDEVLRGKNRFVIQVVGDSMEPTIGKFDYVVCEYHRKPRNSRVVLMQPGTAELAEEESAVKRLREREDAWVFVSDNPEYDDIVIPKDEFNEAYPIVGEVIYNLTRRENIR